MSIIESVVWFFQKNKKAEPVINKAISFGGIFIQSDASLDKFYKIYKKNQFVRSAVTNLMDTIWKGGFDLIDFDGDTVADSISNDINELFKTKRKKRNTNAFQEFLKRVIRDYFIGGNVYVYKVTSIDEAGNKSDIVTGLQILDPRFMSPVTDKFGNIGGYIQNVSWSIQAFLPDEIWHLRYDSDIDDETIGMPLLESLNTDIDLDEEAKESNLAYFRNNQTPASLIILESSVSVEDLVEIKKALQEQFKWWKNHHKGWVMKWVKEVVKLQDKITDAEFLSMRKFTLENVCALFGVPKTILWYTEGVNYSNADKQFIEYIEHTIRPTENTIAEFFTEIIQDLGFDGVEFEFIDDHVDQKAIKSKTVIELANNGIITPNEAREELWLEQSEEKEAYILWISTNKKKLSSKENIDTAKK